MMKTKSKKPKIGTDTHGNPWHIGDAATYDDGVMHYHGTLAVHTATGKLALVVPGYGSIYGFKVDADPDLRRSDNK